MWVDFEDPRLAHAEVTTTVTSSGPIVVERAMWWGDATGRYGAHVAAGVQLGEHHAFRARALLVHAQPQGCRAARARQAQRAAEAAARAAPQIQLVVALLLVPAVLLLVAAALIPAIAPLE